MNPHFEECVENFNAGRLVALRNELKRKLPSRGEEVRVCFTDPNTRVFVKQVTRLQKNTKNENWSLSIRDKRTKDLLKTLFPTYLQLIEDGVPKYLVEYCEQVLTPHSYPEPFYLIEAGLLLANNSPHILRV